MTAHFFDVKVPTLSLFVVAWTHFFRLADIPKNDCTARGCCFLEGDRTGTGDSPVCFFDEPGVPVTKAHVIFSNHFDAGYADLTSNVVNEYFQTYFPRAARLGDQLRAANITKNLAWMTQAWLISLYLDCPPNLGLACPPASNLTIFKRAVAQGDITWHAFPHNSQMSLGSAPLYASLLEQVQLLDDRLDSPFPPKTTLSQRDVVGITSPVIPVLKAHGVNAISVGSNGRCLPVNVPTAFNWADGGLHAKEAPVRKNISPPSNQTIFAIWHPYGYGQLAKKSLARCTACLFCPCVVLGVY